jgi:methylamine dehydrogenase accessory protein MauD
MTSESKIPAIVLLLLTSINVFLMAAIAVLFIRMNHLQSAVLSALAPLPADLVEQRVSELELGLKIGSQAPPFTLLDTAGQMVSLDELTGQKMLLVFFSPQCSACVSMLPHLKALKESEKKVQLVLISKGSIEQNQQLVMELGAGVLVLGWDETTVREYKVPLTPFFYAIDEEGTIGNRGSAVTSEQLEGLIEVGGLSLPRP